MGDSFRSVTCSAPVNIAVIKYWGNENEELILPVNSSLSVTLGQNELRAKTSVAISKSFKDDRMWLNSKEQPVTNPRIQNVLKEIRRKARKRPADQEKGEEGLLNHVHICSENNFPTAAGLASSAAGYACLVYALAKLYGVEGEISDIARSNGLSKRNKRLTYNFDGSGSACRSLYGGFVEWQMSQNGDGSDCYAVQVAPESHWPEMRALILVVSDQKKHVSSSEGMQKTMSTSDLIHQRIELVDNSREDMIEAIKKRNFRTFAKITMQESNQLHAVCLDTYPPIFYMTDVSRLIVRLVHSINDILGEAKVCYTFDAGPNACLYLLEEDVPRVLSLVRHFFPPDKESADSFVKGIAVPEVSVDEKFLSQITIPQSQGAVKYVISTGVGPGPMVLKDPSESLFTSDGKPRIRC